jgi:hypothetical protein
VHDCIEVLPLPDMVIDLEGEFEEDVVIEDSD